MAVVLVVHRLRLVLKSPIYANWRKKCTPDNKFLLQMAQNGYL